MWHVNMMTYLLHKCTNTRLEIYIHVRRCRGLLVQCIGGMEGCRNSYVDTGR